MIKYYKHTILQITIAMLIATVLGMYIIPFAGTVTPAKIWAVISGLAVISLVGNIRTMITSIRLNGKLIGTMKQFFPKSTDELRRMGVKTPLDFVYAMGNTTMYSPLSPFDLKHLPTLPLASPKIYKLGISMFEEMFGRKPLGYKSRDWDYIIGCEVREVTGKNEEECKKINLDEMVSEEIKDYFSNVLPRRFAAVSEGLRIEERKTNL